MSDPNIARRNFLRGTAALSAAAYSRVLGANDRIHLGVIGPGDRGRYDMSQFQEDPTVDVVAVCDIYGEQIDKARQRGNLSSAIRLFVLDRVRTPVTTGPAMLSSREIEKAASPDGLLQPQI